MPGSWEDVGPSLHKAAPFSCLLCTSDPLSCLLCAAELPPVLFLKLRTAQQAGSCWEPRVPLPGRAQRDVPEALPPSLNSTFQCSEIHSPSSHSPCSPGWCSHLSSQPGAVLWALLCLLGWAPAPEHLVAARGCPGP